MQEIFDIVYRFLMYMAAKTGFTYFEVNIILYYMIIPLVYGALVDRIYKFHYVKIGVVIAWLIGLLCIKSFSVFSERAFAWSQDFLLSWEWLGMNYVAASVIFCVIVPVGLFITLLKFIRRE